MIENNGARLRFEIDSQDNEIDRVLEPCIHLARTLGKITVKEINEQPSQTSPYLPALARVMKKRKDHRYVYFEA